MKNKIFSICTLFLITFSAATCKKGNTLEMELAKLPPATQTGQNTFGFLVNGKAWIAQNKDCAIFCDPSFRMYYDHEFGGNIFIDVYWLDSRNKINQAFELWFDSSNVTLKHQLTIQKKMTGVRFINYNVQTDCNNYERYSDSSVVYSGEVNVTRYDLGTGIISGTFDAALIKPGCDTLKITHGRFDKKL